MLSSILKLAAAFNVEISEETQAVYAESLSHLSELELRVAAGRTAIEWDKPNQMPTLKFILDRATPSPKLLAENAWEQVQEIIYRHWHPDVGFDPGWKDRVESNAALDYAIRQCGGLRRIHDVPKDAFQFMRRDFIEAFTRFVDEGGDQVKLSPAQAKSFLDQHAPGFAASKAIK